jgi:hypothetical protein
VHRGTVRRVNEPGAEKPEWGDLADATAGDNGFPRQRFNPVSQPVRSQSAVAPIALYGSQRNQRIGLSFPSCPTSSASVNVEVTSFASRRSGTRHAVRQGQLVVATRPSLGPVGTAVKGFVAMPQPQRLTRTPRRPRCGHALRHAKLVADANFAVSGAPPGGGGGEVAAAINRGTVFSHTHRT